MKETMRKTAVGFLACLALACCSSPADDGVKPAPPRTPAPTTPTATPTEDPIQACTNVLLADGESSAPECSRLTLDGYFTALQTANALRRKAILG